MHRGQQLQAEGRLEAFHQPTHTVEALARARIGFQEGIGIVHRARHQRQRLVGCIAAVGIASHQVPFNGEQHMPQVLGIGPVGRLHVLQPQRLAGLLHKVHQLVHLQQRDGRVQQAADVAAHQLHQRRAARGHRGHLAAVLHHVRRRRALGFIDAHAHVGQFTQGRLDAGPNIAPLQPAQATAQRRNGHRPDATRANLAHQRRQARINVLDPALALPVPLGGKVDDEAGCGQLAHLVHEHAAGLHLFALAGRLIGLEVLGPGDLELQRDATAHDAHAVDGVDDRVGIVLQDVAAGQFDHCGLLVSSTRPAARPPGAGARPRARRAPPGR
mmetsp:Transcript_43971/g.77548  ORF Transcript_43971/g.77548 Transcript_43971/m.77548 type:complete len:329 (-) Transcript_43971:1069-2055(-)